MAGKHPRNLAGLRAARRCGVKTRSGEPCRAPAIAGALRCRMHGGKGAGAPRGNRNAQKHGAYSKRVRNLRAVRQAFEKAMRVMIEQLDDFS
ncbi:hypothetical protein GCM10023208_21580 [Erythrobacter westpacificensis]|uniref:Glucans biosynthesis protein n=1 Tax=Erythrobacter westpacificensis TaxID=1055231 RepID=A0ABP9KEH9_9SPHN